MAYLSQYNNIWEMNLPFLVPDEYLQGLKTHGETYERQGELVVLIDLKRGYIEFGVV